MKHESIQVENIKCDGCMSTIRKELLKQPGVLTVHVDSEKQLVDVTGDDTMNKIHLIARLEYLGYPEAGHNDFLVHGCDFHMQEHTTKHAVIEYSEGRRGAQEVEMFRIFSDCATHGPIDSQWGEITWGTQKVLDALIESAAQESRPVLLNESC